MQAGREFAHHDWRRQIRCPDRLPDVQSRRLVRRIEARRVSEGVLLRRSEAQIRAASLDRCSQSPGVQPWDSELSGDKPLGFAYLIEQGSLRGRLLVLLNPGQQIVVSAAMEKVTSGFARFPCLLEIHH
jgi:hypothetical protein